MTFHAPGQPLAPTPHRLLRPSAASLGLMFATGAFGRALILTIIPIEAFILLQGERNASLFFLLISGLNLGLSFGVPALLRRYRRARIYAACILICAAGPLFLATGSLTGLPFGALCREFGGTALFIMQNLYMMDHVARRDFVRAEPIRLFFQAIAWGAGPYIGMLLYVHVDPWAAFGLATTAMLGELIYFRSMGLKEMVPVESRQQLPTNPLRFVPRFFSQPRLRLAYALAVSRSTWWAVLNVYGPIYIVKTGGTATLGGLLVSACNLMLLTTPLVGWMAVRLGIRSVVMGSFVIAGVATVGIAFAYPSPWAGFALFLSSGLAVVALDATATVPYLRAVRARERAEMTMVFMTYGQVSQLVPLLVFSVLLTFLDLPVVFVLTAATLLWAAWISRWIPRSM